MRQILRRPTAALLGGAAALAAATDVALAHHPTGGETPVTFGQGLLSGLAHPVIGPDHLAAIVAAGLIAAVVGAGPTLPLAFILAGLAGVALHLTLVDLPFAEILVALSVVAFGLVLLARRRLPGGVATLAALFAAAGVVHGYAYGESIVGAETAPLGAYLIGLTAVQGTLAAGACLLAGRLAAAVGEARTGTGLRVAAAVVLLVGAGALASAV